MSAHNSADCGYNYTPLFISLKKTKQKNCTNTENKNKTDDKFLSGNKGGLVKGRGSLL